MSAPATTIWVGMASDGIPSEQAHRLNPADRLQSMHA
jgi:hypothetical protein